MTECEEVARSMKLTRQLSYSQALELVKEQMPDEGMTVTSNVAWALHIRSMSLPTTFKGEPTYTAMVRYGGRFYESEGSMTVEQWRAFNPASVLFDR